VYIYTRSVCGVELVLYASTFQKNPHGTGARLNGDGVAVRSVFGLDGEDHREGDQRRPKEAAEAHERSKEDKGDKWHRVERSSGQFVRRFRLPENAKTEEVRARAALPPAGERQDGGGEGRAGERRAHGHRAQGRGQEARGEEHPDLRLKKTGGRGGAPGPGF
jgi:hypothetical protein